jgi:hypothetical protein
VSGQIGGALGNPLSAFGVAATRRAPEASELSQSLKATSLPLRKTRRLQARRGAAGAPQGRRPALTGTPGQGAPSPAAPARKVVPYAAPPCDAHPLPALHPPVRSVVQQEPGQAAGNLARQRGQVAVGRGARRPPAGRAHRAGRRPGGGRTPALAQALEARAVVLPALRAPEPAPGYVDLQDHDGLDAPAVPADRVPAGPRGAGQRVQPDERLLAPTLAAQQAGLGVGTGRSAAGSARTRAGRSCSPTCRRSASTPSWTATWTHSARPIITTCAESGKPARKAW